MKPLETTIQYQGHTLKQIWREKDVAVYTRHLKPESTPHEVELVFIQAIPDKVMPNGENVPEHEAYPSPSKWGHSGWSFPIRYQDRLLVLAGQCCKNTEGRRALVKQWRELYGAA